MADGSRKAELVLTSRQRQVLDHIADYWANFNRSPRITDIAQRLGCSKQNTAELIARLKDAGYLMKTGGWRSIELTEQKPEPEPEPPEVWR